MAQTRFPTIYEAKKRYIPNSFRTKKVNNHLLVVTEQGSWIALTKEEYKSFMGGRAVGALLSLLEAKGIAITEDNTNSILELQKKRNYFLKFGTTLHIIVSTLRCNQQCIYCHSAAFGPDNKEKDMSIETAQKILDFIFQTPAKGIKIEFQGGETLLNFDVFKFIVKNAKELSMVKNKKLKMSLVTNLTLLDDHKLEWIAKEGVDISTSLDGPKEIHDMNRPYFGGTGTYDEVIRMMRKCREKNVPVGALMVTTRHSFADPEGIIDEYVKQGMRVIQLKYINKLGFADTHWQELGYTPEEYIQFWKRCMDYMIEQNKKGKRIMERITLLMLQKILTPTDPGFLDFRNPCGTVIGQMSYNYNGDIFPCDEARAHEIFNLGNVCEKRYKEVIASPKAQNMIKAAVNETLYCDACIYKPFCGACPVMSYAEEGNIIPKIAKNSRCKIFKAQFDYLFDKLLFDNEARKVLVSWLEK
jgi:His-Xaa-Ser system radical SAM maturase HxsB